MTQGLRGPRLSYTRDSVFHQVPFYTMQGLHFKFIETETFGNKSRQVTFFKSLFYLGAYNGLGGSVINNQLCQVAQ